MIRILHLIGSSQSGGVETFVTSLAAGIDRSRFAISVCILDDDGPVAAKLRSLGVPVSIVGTGLTAFASFIRLVHGERFDIVHANTGGRLFRRAAVLAGMRRILVHVHGPQRSWGTLPPSRTGLRKELRDAVSGSTRAVVCARWIERLFLDAGLDDVPQIDVVRYGVSSPGSIDGARIRFEYSLAGDAVVIGFVGRLAEQKGIADLRQVISRIVLERNDIAFLVVGDGALMPELRELQGYIGSDRLILTGFQDEPSRLISVMDIVAMPSRWEGLSIAHLEAMAAGKPVVGYAIDGLTEAAEPGTTGTYVEPGDIDGFVTALFELADDAGKRRTMGEAARMKASKEFDVERMTREIEQIYSDLVR